MKRRRGRLERRRFNWMSSVQGNDDALAALDRELAKFYSQQATRVAYQAMLDSGEGAQPATEGALRAAILAHNPSFVLEIGCGSGRIYEGLLKEGMTGAYTGLEMSPDVITRNKRAYPRAEWITGSIYTVSLDARTYDVVFSYFVMEHCVYPARVLDRMVELARPGGSVILVFPDFREMGRFASQPLGFFDGRARERLRRGDVINALFNLYESRIRLPRALKRATARYGPFPVNLSPRCFDLDDPRLMASDFDAVYMSSKQEVQAWAASKGLAVRYPAGIEGNFRENALIEVLC